MKKFETLYARDSAGRINQWDISVENDGGSALIIISEGLIDGKKSETSRRISKGKNIGKMNETSTYQQACNEAKSRWEKKLKQGYKSLEEIAQLGKYIVDEAFWEEYKNDINLILEKGLPKNRTDANNISKPMKAQPYFKDDGTVRIKFPCFGQPKLNGFRVICRWEKVTLNPGTIFCEVIEKPVFRSKEGLKYDILEHIEMTKDMFITNDGKNLAFDGEMYIHGEILSEISSAVRKRNPKTEKLQFNIFDLAIENIKQDARIKYLNTFIKKPSNVEFVPTIIINSNEEAQTFTDKCIKEGYEGAIFRDMKAEYQFGKRPQTMTKLKRSQDKEFKIIDVKGGDNTPDLAVFVCVQEEGLIFDCTPEGTRKQKAEYLTNKHLYIGKILTVRFFERTKDNKPFHAVGVAVRDYE